MDARLKVDMNNRGRRLNEEELAKALSNCSGVLAGTGVYSAKVLKMPNKPKVISRLGVELDNIDMDIAQRNNIKVLRTQTNLALAAAKLILGLILDISRKIGIHNNQMRANKREKHMGHLLTGKILGIIGLGNIGKTLVDLTRGFNFKTFAFDLSHDKQFAEENNITYCDLDRLLKVSDIVSLHLNLSKETEHLLNDNRLGRMKPGSILINTSRGGVVDEAALYNLLKEKKIAGAGIDVFEEEPYYGPLTKLDNVILTPHVGAYAKEIRTKMEIEAAKNLIKGLGKNE